MNVPHCKRCGGRMHATYATIPVGEREPMETSRLRRIGSYCWPCRAIEVRVDA